MDEAHERWKRLLAPEGDPSEAFELVEEAFDLMALLVEPPVYGRSAGAAGIGLDLSGCAQIIGDEGAQPIGVISCVGDHMADALEAGQESLGLRTVAMLARRGVDAQRQADCIDGGVQSGRQAAARTTDGGSFSPPFAPAASA